jgi:hypothetical protein
MPDLWCRGCGRELPTQDDVHQIEVHGHPYGPLCASCAERAASMPFGDWLDEMWQRQNPH